MPCTRSSCSEPCAMLNEGSPDVKPNYKFGACINFLPALVGKPATGRLLEILEKEAHAKQEAKAAKASRKSDRQAEARARELESGVPDGMGDTPTRLRNVRKGADGSEGSQLRTRSPSGKGRKPGRKPKRAGKH